MVDLNPGSLFTTAPRKIRVLLVEDNSIFLAYVSRVLARDPAVHIVGRVQDGLDAIQSAAESAPDLVLLDIGLPRMNGLQVAKHILRGLPKCRIIFLTQESAPEFVEHAFEIGAAGYVLKTRANEDLWPAVLNVCEGNHFLSSGLERPTKFQSGILRLVAT